MRESGRGVEMDWCGWSDEAEGVVMLSLIIEISEMNGRSRQSNDGSHKVFRL